MSGISSSERGGIEAVFTVPKSQVKHALKIGGFPRAARHAKPRTASPGRQPTNTWFEEAEEPPIHRYLKGTGMFNGTLVPGSLLVDLDDPAVATIYAYYLLAT